MSHLVAIIGLGVVIFIHEAGHFLAARAVGMRPRKFYIGFGPALVKLTRNGIEYGIGILPLGGYVKIPGMHRPVAGDLDVYFAKALKEAPELVGPLERVRRPLRADDLAGARAALVELTERVQAASLSAGPRRSAERGLRELADGFAPDAYWRQQTWRRIVAIFAGPASNLVLALVLFTALFMQYGKDSTSILRVTAHGPAAHGGLRSGDRIIGINGLRATPASIRTEIAGSKGRPLNFLVARGDDVKVIGPLEAVRQADGRYRVGIQLGQRLGLPGAAWESLQVAGRYTGAVGHSLAHLFTKQNRKQLSGPVGIVQASSAAARAGIADYLYVLAVISLSLALLNLLPLLPLDGGHIAFSLVEGIRRRPLRREVYERVSALGIAFSAVFFVIALSNDIGRLGGH